MVLELWAFGKIPKARGCRRLLGLWDWEIYSMLGLWVFGTVPTSQDCPLLLGQFLAFRSLILRNILHGVGTLDLWDSPTQRPGTVPGFWDSPKGPGLSQAFGSVRLRNNPHSVGTLGFWDSPNLPGLSQAFGRVPRSRDCPKFKDFVLAV